MKQLSKNKTSKTQASIDIILQDEEMKELLRKLVKKSDEKGADISLSHLQKALQVIWKEVSVKATTEQVSYTLSPDQENFAKKVDAFLEHFGEDLVQHHNRCASSYPFKEDDKEDSSRKARFFISIKTILNQNVFQEHPVC